MARVVYRSVPDHEQHFVVQQGGECRILSVMIHDRLTVNDVDAYPRLEAIITRSDGYEHLPADVMRERGIAGYHLADYATDSVAHLTLTFLLMLARRIPEGIEATKSGWRRDHLVGHHLPEWTVGVIGLGRIGSRVVELLDALGVATIGYDIDPKATAHGRHHRRGTLAEIQSCNAVTLHVPATPGTRHLVDEKFLQAMHPGAVLVNTARGEIVATHDLVTALDSGKLAGYATDVLPGEPEVPDRPLLEGRSNVVMTPHLGAQNRATIEARYALHDEIVQAIREGRADDVAHHRVI